MDIKVLDNKPQQDQDEKLKAAYNQFDLLLAELRKKDLPDSIVNTINEGVDQLNSSEASGKDFKKAIKATQARIIKQMEKEVKLVTKNYYRNTWFVLGMTAFGVPMGLAFSMSLGSMAYLGLGFPIGMAIGFAIGSNMDKKALNEGRQIDLEIKP